MSNVVGIQSKNLSMLKSHTTTDLKRRLQANSKNLNDLLYGQSPFQKKFNRNNSRESSESSSSGKDGHLHGVADSQQQNGVADRTKYETKPERRNSQNFETTLKLFKENCKPIEGIINVPAKSVINRQNASAPNLQNGGTSLYTKKPLTSAEKRRLKFQSSREKGTASSFATSFSSSDNSSNSFQTVEFSDESIQRNSRTLAEVKSNSYHGEDSQSLLNSSGDLKHSVTKTSKCLSSQKSISDQNIKVLQMPLIHSKVWDNIKQNSTNHLTSGSDVSNHVTSGIKASNHVTSEADESNHVISRTDLSNHVTSGIKASNHVTNEVELSKKSQKTDKTVNQKTNQVQSKEIETQSNENVQSRNFKMDDKTRQFNSKSLDNLHSRNQQTLSRHSTAPIKTDISNKKYAENLHSKNSTTVHIHHYDDRPSAFSPYQGQSRVEVAESVTDSVVEMDLTSPLKSTKLSQDHPDTRNGVRKFCHEKIEFNQTKPQNGLGLDVGSESPRLRACLQQIGDTSGLDFTFFVHQNSHSSKENGNQNKAILPSNNKSATDDQIERELAGINWRQRKISGRTKNLSGSHSTTVIGRHLVITPDLFIDDTVPDTTPHAMSELEKMIAKKYQQKRAASPHHRKQLHIIRRPQSVPAKGQVLYPTVATFDPVQPAAPVEVEVSVTNNVQTNSSEPIYMNAVIGNGNQRDVIAKPPRPNKRCYVKRNSKLNPEAIYSSTTSRGFQIYKRDSDCSVASERPSRKDHIKNIQRLFENSSKDVQNTPSKSPNSVKNQVQSSLNSLIKFESRSNHSINEKQCLGKDAQNSQNVANLQKNMSIRSNTSQVTMRSVASQVSDPENLATGKQNTPPKKFKFKNMWKHKKGKYRPSLEDLTDLTASKIHSNFKSLPNISSNKDFESNICMSLPNSPGVKNSLSVVDMGDIAKLDNMLTKQYFGNTKFDQFRKSKNKKSGAKSLEEMKKLFYSEPSISLKRSHEDLKGSTHFSSATTEYHTSLVTGIVNDDTLSDINPDIFDSDAAGSTDNGLFPSSKSLNRDKNSSCASSNSGSRSPFVHSSSVVPDPVIPQPNPTIEISHAPDKNPDMSDSFTISDLGPSQIDSLQLSSCYYSSTQRESESDTEPIIGINHSRTKSAFHPVEGHSKVQGQIDKKVEDDITSVSSLSVSTTTRGFSVHDTESEITFQPYAKTKELKSIKDPQILAKSSKVFSDNLSTHLSYGAEDSGQPSLISSQVKKIEMTGDNLVIVSGSEDIEMSTFSIQAQDSLDFAGNFDAELLRAKRKRLTKLAPVQSPSKSVHDSSSLKSSDQGKSSVQGQSTEQGKSSDQGKSFEQGKFSDQGKSSDQGKFSEEGSSLNVSEFTALTKKTESPYSSPKREVIVMTELTPKSQSVDPLYARVNKGRKEKEVNALNGLVEGGMPLYAAINKEKKHPSQTSDEFIPRHSSTSTCAFSPPYATVQDSVSDKISAERNPSPPYATVEECVQTMKKEERCENDEYFVTSPPYESLDECRETAADANSIKTVKKSENLFQDDFPISPPYASVDECKTEINHIAQPIYTSVDECRNETRDTTLEAGLNESGGVTHYESVVDMKMKTSQNSVTEAQLAPIESAEIPKSASQCSLYQTIDQVRGQIDERKSDSGIQVESSEQDMPLGESACSQRRENLYAKVGTYRKKSVNGAECVVSNRLSLAGDEVELMSDDDQGPPLPARRYKTESSSNLSKTTSTSRPSLLNKMGLIKNSTKTKLKSFRKAVSLERGLDDVNSINVPSKTEKLEKSKTKIRKAPSLKSLTALFGKKSKSKKEKSDSVLSVFDDSPDKLPVKNSNLSLSKKKLWSSAKNLEINSVEPPKMLRCIGKLLEICSDGSKVVELQKPPDGPIGFYIGRGTANYDYGIFISRFPDESLQKLFSGLMAVGDEVIEINQRPIRDMSLDDVYGLMADKSKLVLRIFPISCRRDL